MAGAAEAPFLVGGDGQRVGLSPGAARLPAPLRDLAGRVLALPFQATEPSPQLRPRGLVTKEKELKSLLMAA